MNLAVATTHVQYDKLAEAFTKVTSKPARFVDSTEDESFALVASKLRKYRFGQDYAGMKDDDDSLMTYEDNFRGFWRMWQLSGGDKPLIQRDYALLNEILPDRVRSVEELSEKQKDLCMAVAEDKLETVIKRHEDTVAMRHHALPISKLSWLNSKIDHPHFENLL